MAGNRESAQSGACEGIEGCEGAGNSESEGCCGFCLHPAPDTVKHAGTLNPETLNQNRSLV